MNKIEMNIEGGIYDEENIFCAMLLLSLYLCTGCGKMNKLWITLFM